ncbi:MAG TPA: O-antigen ligase family protein [Pirellulaceae bacterium]|nr:O-antigen ligase family protein [Pirellulaceae bacterium]
MSTAATNLPLSLSPPLPLSGEVPRWPLLLTALVIGLVIFVTEHDLSISQADAFTQTADEMEVTAEGGNFVRRLAFPSLALLGLVLAYSTKRQPWRINLLLALPMGSYLALAATSYLWSYDPGMTMRRLIVVGCCTVAGVGIARRFSMHELCLLTLAIVGPLTLLGLAAELRLGTFRPWSGDYRFSGSVHPNTQTSYLTALALAALGLARSGSRWKVSLWTIFAASLVLMVLTKSRTGNAATLAAIASVFLVQTSLRFKFSAGLAAAWIGLGGLWLLLIAGYDPLVDFHQALLLGRAEESDTLSGRSFIWPAVGYFIDQRPWLGYGFEAFWNPTHVETISEEVGWGLREAHNGYLEMLLSLGIVGLGLALATVAAGVAAAVRGGVKLRDPAYSLPLGMLVYGVLVSAMESGMVIVEFATFLTGVCLLRMALFEKPVPQVTHDK